MNLRRSGIVMAIALSLGCAVAIYSSATPPAPDSGSWTMVAPVNVALIGKLGDSRLGEASGAALSVANPGLFWTIDDSGNPPDLYAVDSTGALKADFALTGATNVDWEEVAVGPCGAGRCVYIADTGDNNERRKNATIYRVTEPAIIPDPRVGARPLTGVESIRLVYPDQPHDVEAMAVTSSGEILLVTKGRSRGILVFSVPASAWGSTRTVTPQRRDSLPIVAAGGMGREVTGMALSPDGKRVVVRTYRDLYPFTIAGDGSFVPMGKPTGCDILGREPQGEGITFLNDRQLLLTSERGLFKAGTLIVLECPPLNQ
ncbi:MAG: hypothetical protein ABIS00_14215 [Gemmatimonadales bacterium]